MAQTTVNEGLNLAEVLDDLKVIVGEVKTQDDGSGASYDAVQKGLPNLRLHILTYIRFLENNDYVEYDRVADIIKVSSEGDDAVLDDSVWREKARVAFEQHLDPSEQGSSEDDLLDEFDVEMDDILESISAVEESGLDFDSEGDAPLPALKTSDDDPTGPSHETPERASNGSTSASDTDSSTPGTTMNSNDGSFRDRRYSSSSSKAAPRSASDSSNAMLYEREEEIGSGGMGTVYKARQVKLDRAVAVKEVKEIFDVFAGVQRSDIVKRFTEIIQTQSSLVHPNIIQVIDIDTDARFPFVVMQYAPNGNLRRLIEVEGRPPLQVALKYFLQILHALSAAHDEGVTHGGIKPENVVLDSAGNAMLTDFGISQVVELDSSKANQVYVGVGTVAYMSPEQFRDPNTASVKSDIYSLGIMFYEMLTGKVPGRRSPMPSSFYPDIPRKLDDIFDQMSMDDEGDRYDSVDEILAEFYGATEVMNILDKRGGFVFLRDPMTHGATGLSIEIVEDDGGGFAEHASLDEDSSDAESLDEDSSDVEHEEDDFEGDEDADVLDKLDKYGKMFDEEDEDSDAEVDADDEEVENEDEEDDEGDEDEASEDEE